MKRYIDGMGFYATITAVRRIMNTKQTEENSGLFALVLAAAGQSSRFSGKDGTDRTIKKTFVRLGGKPVWLRCVDLFRKQESLAQIIVVVAPEDIGWFRQYYAGEINSMLISVVAGGENRVDSIRRGLMSVSPKVDYVAVHDAARPCVSVQEIAAVLSAAQKYGAAVLAAPIVATVKKAAGDQIEKTIPREGLWESQTPQVFRRELLLEAYQQRISFIPTDDAQLVELLGHPVYIVPSDRRNIKITTPSDLMLAKYWLEQTE
ncbi:MAG: 2-C-methyl-D-erythritol 4-phosphate cytidylyltransferase [Planctomycetaceae bacterium]|nr:2-C-methyl-D-erythritol 4-phosphate cytidylyltransferase [Planctomycetaceae bacterium]